MDAQEGTSELQSVFPLPPGEASSLFPYKITDDEFRYSETATFLITGTDVDAVMAFYQEMLPSMGYELGEPMELGASKAMSISDPDNPNVTGVVQAGPVSPTDSTVQLNQERIETKDQ